MKNIVSAANEETTLPKLDFAADIVVLDPPRKGCDRAVLDSLLVHRAKRIVYMSCKPATFARDLQILCAGVYHLRLVQPADFFPQTAHVEAAAFPDRIVYMSCKPATADSNLKRITPKACYGGAHRDSLMFITTKRHPYELHTA
jgi:tRNA/tmRNA/rRNA uracil-C5-methylase (TrmA/RlmC/RlmD family)